MKTLSDYPFLLKEFESGNNNNTKPDQIEVKRSKVIIWTCKTGHNWSEQLTTRIENDPGCPYCLSDHRSVSEKQLESNGFTFDFIQSEIRNFMTTNQRLPTTSENLIIRKIYNAIQKGSKEIDENIQSWPHLLSTIIQDTPDAQLKKILKGHYQEKMNENRKRGWKTYGLRFNVSGELSKHSPQLIPELHPTLNFSKSPKKMNIRSKLELWWVCNFNHNFKLSIYARVIKKKGCPICKFDRSLLVRGDHKSKPKYFWQTIYPGKTFASKVIMDYMVRFEKIPSAHDSANVNRVYKAIRNPKVKDVWQVEDWSELLRIAISTIDEDLAALRDKLIDDYNEVAEKQKHRGWIKIIV